jgi:hypothetical protein
MNREVIVQGLPYRVWFDRLGRRWRWARCDWRDDGYGYASHGAEDTRDAAVLACERHADFVASLR